jgi:molybdate transport system permease protein
VGEFGATVTLAGAVVGKTETIPVAIYLRLADVDITGAVALILLLSGISLAALAAVRLIGGGR